MTWSLSMSGHGDPNDEANRSARKAARELAERLQAEGQHIGNATFSDNEGTHNLLEPLPPENAQ